MLVIFAAILLGVLGQFSDGVPLEDPSTDFSQFFEQRIVGGSTAAQGRSPHMVALVVGFTWQSFICGGSILTDKHILTAAHCITSFILWEGDLLDTFHAIIGTNTWNRGTIVEIKDYKLHPHYNAWTLKHDAGLLLAKKRIQFNDRVAPIRLNYDFVGGGEKSFVTGWGTDKLWGNIPSKLQILYVSTISPKACIEGVKAAAAEWGGNAPHVDPFLEICTFHSVGSGMCHGDSGSALVSIISGLQSGIVSWGIPCAVGGPDVFVRVSGVKDFIKEALRTLK